MNKVKLIVAILLFVFALVIQGVSLPLYGKIEPNVFCLVAGSSAIPIASGAFLIASLIPQKHKILRFVIIFFGGMAIFMFSIMAIIALTEGFTFVDGKYVA